MIPAVIWESALVKATGEQEFSPNASVMKAVNP
jgi:hypothetical protein